MKKKNEKKNESGIKKLLNSILIITIYWFFPDASRMDIVKTWPCVKQSLVLTTQTEKVFENIVGEGENTGNQHFLLFSTMFSTFPKTNAVFWSH